MCKTVSSQQAQFGKEYTIVNNNILLITPPDKVHNQNISVLLIHPSDAIKNQTHHMLADVQDSVNVYIYDPAFEEQVDLDWLLDVARFSETVIFDIDNSCDSTRQNASYLVSLANVYWLTSATESCYNKLSVNRIYDLEILGGYFGKER